ncbi:MAG TPA: M20/M25/M40 family metallo-hydrolase [Thermoanaerobaculia bacterium]|nr:M20/M25/M40 family metallo-hydrolase [Thermoanaerobaculia bacterium]
MIPKVRRAGKAAGKDPMHRVLYLTVLLPFFFITSCISTTYDTSSPPLPDAERLAAARELMTDSRILRAFEHIESNRDAILAQWITLTEINAPSGHEQERARYVETLLRAHETLEVRRDSAGNVIATRKGTGGGPTIVLDAHLDTVFQPGLEIEATVRDGRLHAPGVGDATRNIEAILATLRALDAAGISTKGDLIALFTVEEETNFRGVNQFIADNRHQIDHFLAFDGGFAGFSYGGIGIHWYRHHFMGPGGHTLSSTPPWSATVPAARAIDRIARLQLPRESAARLNIGMMGGADVVNAKASDAWFTVDLRSTDDEVLQKFENVIRNILEEEAKAAGMKLHTEVISKSPAAQIPGHRNSYLVRTAEAVHIAAGFENPPIHNSGANNASVALRNGISALSTGTAPCSNAHALTESCAIEPFYKGIRKMLLLAVALAELDPGD